MALAIAKATVVAVGGLGTQADKHADNGGGATKTVWDANAPTDFIANNGGPISADTGITYDHAGGTPDRKFSKAGIGTGVTVGTLAYVSGTNITTGIYEITSIDGGGAWVACANITATGDNADSVMNIGGAIDTLQNALDDNDASSYERNILYNISSVTLAASIDVDTYSGSANVRLFVKGANSNCVVDGTRPVITTDQSLANGLLHISSQQYIEWWYLDFNAAGANLADYCVFDSQSDSSYQIFFDCILRGALDVGGAYSISWGWKFIKCNINGNGYGASVHGDTSGFYGGSVHDNTGEGILFLCKYGIVYGCLIYDNGANGVLSDSGADNNYYIGNTFFGNTGDGLDLPAGSDWNTVFNNTSCGNGAFGYQLADIGNCIYFGYNHSCDNQGDANDNTSGHCNLLTDPTSDSEFQVYREGNNQTGSPSFTNIGDGVENFLPTAGNLIANAADAGTA